MDIVKTNCPKCGRALEFPRDFDNVTCSRCATAYYVRRYGGALSLSPIDAAGASGRAESNGAGGREAIEARLDELDEEISELSSNIEEIRSKEQGAPLQLGCALFGLCGLVLLVFAFFMTVGRSYFGGWLFYLSLAAVVALALVRMRRRLASPEHLDDLRSRRATLEDALAELESERDRLKELKESITTEGD
jgi:hypothetical protein